MQQQWLDILYSYVEKEYLVIRILNDWNRDNGDLKGCISMNWIEG